MASHLVIVESPAKARTIEKYLGKDFKVLASYGHVRDLVPKEGAVETDNNFKMNYTPVERNNKHIATIKRSSRRPIPSTSQPTPTARARRFRGTCTNCCARRT